MCSDVELEVASAVLFGVISRRPWADDIRFGAAVTDGEPALLHPFVTAVPHEVGEISAAHDDAVVMCAGPPQIVVVDAPLPDGCGVLRQLDMVDPESSIRFLISRTGVLSRVPGHTPDTDDESTHPSNVEKAVVRSPALRCQAKTVAPRSAPFVARHLGVKSTHRRADAHARSNIVVRQRIYVNSPLAQRQTHPEHDWHPRPGVELLLQRAIDTGQNFASASEPDAR